jgi:hypothetical protein
MGAAQIDIVAEKISVDLSSLRFMGNSPEMEREPA